MRDPYLLAGCFAAGFLLTAGISLWKARDSGEVLARVAPSPGMAAVASPHRSESPATQAPVGPWNRTPARPPQPDATPLVELAPASAAVAQELTPETAQQPEQQARRPARRAAERDGH